MDIRFDFSNIRSTVVGAENGLTDQDIEQCESSVEQIIANIDAQRQTGTLAYLDLPYQDMQAKSIEQTANNIANDFDTFVVLGIGGSALGGIALHQALRHPFYNMLPDQKKRQSSANHISGYYRSRYSYRIVRYYRFLKNLFQYNQ